MAASPKYKVYTPRNEYVASCKYASDAAAILACYGEGATIRTGHAKRDIVYTETSYDAEDGAWNSYDYVAYEVFKAEDANR